MRTAAGWPLSLSEVRGRAGLCQGWSGAAGRKAPKLSTDAERVAFLFERYQALTCCR